MANLFAAITNASRQKNHIAPVDNRGGWTPWIREPYSGAWQRNDEWSVDTVLAFHAVYACITLISTDIGKLPIGTMRKDSHGIWVDSKLDGVTSVLKKPNRYQNHIQFKEWWTTSKLIAGNTYALKQRDNRGNVVALYVLDPHRVKPLVAPDGEVFYQLGQDHLNRVDADSITVPASEIIHDRMNCIYHPLVGVSPLFASGLAASQGLSIQNDSKSFWSNGANPGGILTAPGSIDNETAERLKTYWEANYTGDKAGRVAVVGDGLKYEPMRMSSVDAQLIEQLKWTAEVVCSTFHVPAYKIGVGPMPTHDNIDALTQDYYSQCLQTHIENMELSLDEGLSVPDGYRTQLDLDALFRMDTERKTRTLGEGVKGSIMAPNEARKKLNLPPLEGGDSVYLQQQNYSLEALAQRDATNPLAVVAPPALPAPTPEPEPEPEDDDDIEDQSRMLALLFEKELQVEY
jgi:HK97 family phage portal protein